MDAFVFSACKKTIHHFFRAPFKDKIRITPKFARNSYFTANSLTVFLKYKITALVCRFFGVNV